MSEAPAPADAAERGRLDIHPAVLRKIVEHAADQVPGILRSERTVAGLGIGGTSGASAKISQGAADAVDVRLELTLQYPAPVRETVAAVRAHVADELLRIAGHRVRNVAVTVSGLRGAPAAPRLR